MPATVSVEEILRGTGFGRRQSVGNMEVIPILGDDDESFAPPDFEVRTSNYGTVELRNNDPERPTIAPVGAGWVVKEAAQDHAIGGASLLGPGTKKTIDTAMCIQETQGGLISKAKHLMLILPAALRSKALSIRKVKEFGKLWKSISAFNKTYGLGGSGDRGHLEYFLKAFDKQLDEFVAEFELVPGQVGAIVLVNGKLVGVERAPSEAFWTALWSPLIRVCYGSLAIKAALKDKNPPATRLSLSDESRSVDELIKSLQEVTVAERKITEEAVEATKAQMLSLSAADEKLRSLTLATAASPELAGQVVTQPSGLNIPYASLCATNV